MAMKHTLSVLLVFSTFLITQVVCDPPIEEVFYEVLEKSERNLTSQFPRVVMRYRKNDNRTNKGIFMDGPFAVTPTGRRLRELDIAVTDEEIERTFSNETTGRRRRAAINSPLWTNGIVPYVIEAAFYDWEEALIRDAMDNWELTTCIRFVPRTNENDYLSVRGSTSGCWSYVGMQGGLQELSVQWSTTTALVCMRQDIIEHELGHAIGLYHEQSRPDRDQYVNIIWANIQSDNQHNFNIHTFLNSRGLTYDYRSVMHYSKTAWSSNGGITIQTIDPAMQDVIGSATKRSHLDSHVINLMYQCAASCGTTCSATGAFVNENCGCSCPADSGFDTQTCAGSPTAAPTTPDPTTTTPAPTTTTPAPTTTTPTPTTTTPAPTTTTPAPTTTTPAPTTTTPAPTTTTPAPTTTTPAPTTTTPAPTTTTPAPTTTTPAPTTTTPAPTTTTPAPTTTAAPTTTPSCENIASDSWCAQLTFLCSWNYVWSRCRLTCNRCST